MDPIDSLKYKIIYDAPINQNNRLDLMRWPAWSENIRSKVPKDLPCRFCNTGYVFGTNDEEVYMKMLQNGGRAFFGKTLEQNYNIFVHQ